MMALSWRRGFFRVWMVGAILWAMVVAVYAVIIIPSATTTCLCLFAEDKGLEPFVSRDPSYTAIQTEYVNSGRYYMLPYEGLPIVTLYALKRDGGNDAYSEVVERYRAAATTIYQTKQLEYRGFLMLMAVGLAIVPALIVLALGWAIAWALSGFWKRSED